jgi:hypothetical protein
MPSCTRDQGGSPRSCLQDASQADAERNRRVAGRDKLGLLIPARKQYRLSDSERGSEETYADRFVAVQDVGLGLGHVSRDAEAAFPGSLLSHRRRVTHKGSIIIRDDYPNEFSVKNAIGCVRFTLRVVEPINSLSTILLVHRRTGLKASRCPHVKGAIDTVITEMLVSEQPPNSQLTLLRGTRPTAA